MSFDRIITLDLGKFNSVSCTTDAATQRHGFASVATTPEAMQDFLLRRIEAGDWVGGAPRMPFRATRMSGSR